MVVRVYTSGDSVALELNGQAIATNTVAEGDKRVTVFKVPYAPGILTAIASRNGAEISRKSFVTTGDPAAVRLTPDVKHLQGAGRLSHVLVEIVDAEGRLVPDAVEKVQFGISGPGELIAVGSANPHYVDSFQLPRRYTYHGQALAVVRATGETGAIRLTAGSTRAATATLTIPSTPAPNGK
jgi:beta-galactosidase